MFFFNVDILAHFNISKRDAVVFFAKKVVQIGM